VKYVEDEPATLLLLHVDMGTLGKQLWVCMNSDQCKTAAIKTITTHLEIEQRRPAFLNKFPHRIDELETKLDTKIYKPAVDMLSVAKDSLHDKISTLPTNISHRKKLHVQGRIFREN